MPWLLGSRGGTPPWLSVVGGTEGQTKFVEQSYQGAHPHAPQP